MPDELVPVEGIAATTHPFQSRYGQTQLSRDALEKLGRDMKAAGPASFNAHHDPSQVWGVKDVETWVVPTDDGHQALHFRLRAPKSQADAFMKAAQDAGVSWPGFSFSHIEPVDPADGRGSSIRVLGDAADFEDEELRTYAALFEDHATGFRLYQYGAETEVLRVVVEIVVAGVAWDAIKGSFGKLVRMLAERARERERSVALDVSPGPHGPRQRLMLDGAPTSARR